jgi:hypothetical protein
LGRASPLRCRDSIMRTRLLLIAFVGTPFLGGSEIHGIASINLAASSRDTRRGRPFLIPSGNKQTRRVPQAWVLSLGLGFSSPFMVFCWERHSPEWRSAACRSGDSSRLTRGMGQSWRSRAKANFLPCNIPACNPCRPAKILYCSSRTVSGG